MDCIENECLFLHKQKFSLWTENQKVVAKFGRRNIDLVKLIATKAAEDDDSFGCPFIIENCIGSLYYTVNIQENELFTFTDQVKNTVITFKLSLEDSNLHCLLPQEEDEYTSVASVSDKASIFTRNADCNTSYKPVHLCKIISGSIRGSKFLAFSVDGIIFLIDWASKIGIIVGRWPIDPEDLKSGCYGLIAYEPHIEGAISADGALVAVIGPSIKNDNQSYIEIRFFDVKTHESSSKKLTLLNPEVSPSDIALMSFNPFHQNLLYLMCNPDYGNQNLLIVYDHSKEITLAKRSDVLMTGHLSMEYHYETADGPVFIHHGSIMVAVLEEERRCDYIVFLDAIKLDTVATVKLSLMEIVLRYHFIVSTCQTEIAVFTRDENSEDVEVHVFKIPDYDITLKNLCRQAIVGCVEKDKVDELTMLPSRMRDYLKI